MGQQLLALKRVVSYLFLSLLFLGNTFANSTPSMCFIKEKGVHTPVVEYTRDEKSILFVGYTHYGTPTYMAKKLDSIRSWSSNFKSTSVLKELVTCNDETLGVAEGASFTIDELKEILDGVRSPSASRLSASLLAKSKKIKCEMDIDGLFKRPSYIVNRNKKLCSEEEESGYSCQWNQDYGVADNIIQQEGDLVVNDLDDYTKLALSMAYSDWKVEGFNTIDEAFDDPVVVETWGGIFKQVIVDDRDKRLSELAMSAVKSEEAVVLPWGSAHIEGVEQSLLGHGYNKKILDYISLDDDYNEDDENYYPTCPSLENLINEVTDLNNGDSNTNAEHLAHTGRVTIENKLADDQVSTQANPSSSAVILE